MPGVTLATLKDAADGGLDRLTRALAEPLHAQRSRGSNAG